MQLKSLLVTFSLLAAASAQDKLKVMPLGDSITEFGCWRAYLWDYLVTDGVADNIEFVGSMNDNAKSCSISAGDWDRMHEGHAGWLSIDIANQYIEDWMSTYQPEIVMFHLGTNDIFRGHSTQEIIASYTQMVQAMRAQTPTMKIIVDLLIPLPMSRAAVDSLNAAIPAWAEENSTEESPIVVVDCNTDFADNMLGDGVHPNDAGDKLIAERLHEPVVAYIEAALEA